MGIATSAAFAILFWGFMHGTVWNEPDITIATTEFCVAVFLTLLTVTAFINYVRSIEK